ncbi:MAG: 1-acyl-sn-glycerol-3-phosphate acyltransferase [Saprospiraceae bacterium]|nr:1-acyl-sn-glycerol-3-phosphate acyltransferase [Saprospiraceae bacterium]
MIKYFCRAVLSIWGFKITGNYRHDILKKVYAVYPHTSNWDFLLGIMLKGAIPMDVNYVAKDSLFRFPFGWFFRWTGGIPVDRSKRTNFVDSMVDLFNKYDKLSFAIAPEGTRSRVQKFKSGFYHIAVKAKVPIVMVKFDYEHKEAHFSDPFYPTGDYKKDLKIIIDHFKGTKGKNQNQACLWEEEVISVT